MTGSAPAKEADKRPAVTFERISKVFGTGMDGVRAVDDVSLDIRQNEFFTLLGPSGCGKTTLLRMIAGFEFPTIGRILLNGVDVSGLPPFKRPVNTVFQSYALFPHMTVAENIGFGLTMLGKPRAEIEARVAEMLRVVRMEDLAKRMTSQISGGQQQRVALARALAPSPEVLLLDEPLSALDLKLRKAMQIELKRLQQETGITFVFVTHDQEEALTMSDRIAVMSRGKVLQIGGPRDIYDRPSERFVADFIGDTNFVTADLVEAKGEDAVVRFASGRTEAAHRPSGAPERGPVTVAIRPEHARLGLDTASAHLAGTLNHGVYFGTDTHYHLTLDGGAPFTVRIQNASLKETSFAAGQRVGITVAEGCVQVLKD
jgi:spermidine/putrescine transport system ATP-binding protein